MSDVKTLRLSEMIVQQKGSVTRRLVHFVISIALRLFFYRIQIANAHYIPAMGPVIFVLNHPNGLIDPGLIFCALSRRVSFLAKSTLFRIPVIGWMLGVVEALPLYRRIDPNEKIENNFLTFSACAELLRKGRCIALFPEGVSHRTPALKPLKTGAARIALGALTIESSDEPPQQNLTIIPIGIYYSSHSPFRSEALLQCGPPLEIFPPEIDAEGNPSHLEVRQLTEKMTAALQEVTLNFIDVEEQEAVDKAEIVLASSYRTVRLQRSLMEEFQTRTRLILGRRLSRLQAPERWQALENSLLAFDLKLREFGLLPAHLQLGRHSRKEFIGLAIRSILLFLLLPIAFVGLIIHAPAYLICEVLSRFFRMNGPDEGQSTVKILAAIVLMPFTWLVWATAIFFVKNLEVAAITTPSIILCGYVGLRWVEESYDLRGWLQALMILFRQRKLFFALHKEGVNLRKEVENHLKKESNF